MSGGASGSGEQKSIGEKTHISLRSACIVMVIAIIPLTWFIGKLAFGQTALETKIDTTSRELNEKLDSVCKLRDEQFSVSVKRIEDHESRIRDLEKAKKP